jgi:hypothetical protein
MGSTVDAHKKARYGHRDWLVWVDRHGERHAERATAETIKAAMLACGTKRPFVMYLANSGTGFLMTWRIAVNVLSNAKAGYL